MTTAQPTPRRGHTLLGPLSVTAAAGLLLVGLGAVSTGPAGALGGLIGLALVCAVFGSGAAVLGVVARVAPTASMLVALLTYTLQVVVVGLVYLGLSTGGALGHTVDARWLSGGVIAGTLAWTSTLVVVFTRARQPIYDLPSRGTEASVR